MTVLESKSVGSKDHDSAGEHVMGANDSSTNDEVAIGRAHKRRKDCHGGEDDLYQ